MPSQTLPESDRTPRAPEAAPSATAAEEPSFVRIVGLVGMKLSAFGFAVLFMNAVIGPRMIGKGWAFVFIAIGVLAMLFHAVRDADYHIRRAYGFLAYALLGAAVVLTLIKTSNFLAYGWACALAGLCFLLCFSKHETDLEWRKRILATLGGIGGGMAAVGLLGGIVLDGFLPSYGLVLAVLGLVYLCAFITQADPLTEVGYKTGLVIGGAAAFVFLYALLRSVVPALLKMNVSPFFIPTGLLLMFLGVVYGAVSLGIVSDNKLVVQTRRELAGYFYSPVAYIVMLGMALLAGVAYWFFLILLTRGTMYEPIVLRYFQELPPFVVMFVVPAITMRLMAEERRTGTYEVLMCAPVKETTVVLSKYIACLIFFMLLWAIWAFYLIALRVEGGKEFDYRPLLSFYLALALCGSGFVSMGLFYSSLSKNQIIAAVATFISILVIFIMGQLQNFEAIAPLWRSVFKHISYAGLWENSLRGHLQVREMIVQGSFTFFWLYLTTKVMEARRWG